MSEISLAAFPALSSIVEYFNNYNNLKEKLRHQNVCTDKQNMYHLKLTK